MSTQQPNDPVLEITQSILSEAAQRPWLAALLMRRRPEWLTRLAYLAQRIRQLPQHTRRTLRRKLASGLAAAALLLALAGTPTAYAGTIIVDGATCTLANAITTANTGTDTGGCTGGSAGADTIDLTANFTMAALGRLPTVTSDITLEGNGHTIDGNGLYRLFDVTAAGTLTLKNATVTNGLDPNGAGILNAGTLSVINSTISNNQAIGGGGGGIMNYGGDLMVTNSTISGNTALQGGGLAIDSTGTTVVTNSTINGNTATGLYNEGGGIVNFGTLTVTNSTVSGNTATYYGGGIENLHTLMVANSTVSGNTASNSGGIDNYGGVAVATVQNSIVAQQTSGYDCLNIGGSMTSGGYNIESGTICGFNLPSDQQSVSSGSLNLGALANNGAKPHPWTRALGAGSVAIDKIPIGTNGCAATNTDERGGWRANGAGKGGTACDVGAYEFDSTIDAVTAVTLRDLTATGNTSPGVIGVIGAALAALGALVIGRRVKGKARP